MGDLAVQQVRRIRQLAGHAHVDHGDAGAHLARQRVHDGSPAREVGDHLGGDLLRPRRHALGVDPVVPEAFDPQSYNGYAYARNNPVRYTDPTGMAQFDYFCFGSCGAPAGAPPGWGSFNAAWATLSTSEGSVTNLLGLNQAVAAATDVLSLGGTASWNGQALSLGGFEGASSASGASKGGAGSQQGGGFWGRVGDTLTRWLVGEIGGAMRAPFTHIYRGLSNIYGGIRGMISGTPGSIKQVGVGLAELVVGTLFPAINHNGGLFWTGPSLGDQNSYAADVHDVGMKLRPPRDNNKFLRNTSVIEAGQVFTIEPGFYVIDALLAPLKDDERARLIDWKVVDELRPFGGIRIEDNVVVEGNNGTRNLTREAYQA